MVAVCAVNVPGFPIPRARVAAGVPVALVAAGTGELVDLMLHQDTSALEIAAASFDDRLRFMENVLLGRVGDSRQTLTAAVEAARDVYQPDDDPDLEERLNALRASVHGSVDTAPDLDDLRARVHGNTEPDAGGGESDLDSLRSRVHGDDLAEAWDDDGMPIDLDLAECLQASLRARAHPTALIARATKEWTAKERENAASRGAAMPGGRFPIKDCTDVGKAVRALGRAKGDKAAVKRHIKKRAQALGCMSNVPDDWK